MAPKARSRGIIISIISPSTSLISHSENGAVKLVEEAMKGAESLINFEASGKKTSKRQTSDGTRKVLTETSQVESVLEVVGELNPKAKVSLCCCVSCLFHRIKCNISQTAINVFKV